MRKKFAALLSAVLMITSFSLYAYADNDKDNSIPDGTIITIDGTEIKAGEYAHGLYYSDGVLTLDNIRFNGKIMVTCEKLTINVIGENEIIGINCIPLSAPSIMLNITGGGTLKLKYSTKSAVASSSESMVFGNGTAIQAGDLNIGGNTTVYAQTDYLCGVAVYAGDEVLSVSAGAPDRKITVSDGAKLYASSDNGGSGISTCSVIADAGEIGVECNGEATAVYAPSQVKAIGDGKISINGGYTGIDTAEVLADSGEINVKCEDGETAICTTKVKAKNNGQINVSGANTGIYTTQILADNAKINATGKQYGIANGYYGVRYNGNREIFTLKNGSEITAGLEMSVDEMDDPAFAVFSCGNITVDNSRITVDAKDGEHALYADYTLDIKNGGKVNLKNAKIAVKARTINIDGMLSAEAKLIAVEIVDALAPNVTDAEEYGLFLSDKSYLETPADEKLYILYKVANYSALYSMYSDGVAAKSVRIGYEFSAGESVEIIEIYPG